MSSSRMRQAMNPIDFKKTEVTTESSLKKLELELNFSASLQFRIILFRLRTKIPFLFVHPSK